jgi:mannose-6-phosphate isomerase-like protein (cupin superfamily)
VNTATPDRMEWPGGSVFVVDRSATETEGESVSFELTIAPGLPSPPPHLHPRSSDLFQMVDGQLEIMSNGVWRTLAPGDELLVPAGTPHTVRNSSGVPVTVREIHRPALRMEAYVQSMYALTRALGIHRARDPRLAIVFAVVTVSYPDTLILARAGERALARVLAMLGRALGWDELARPSGETGRTAP